MRIALVILLAVAAISCKKQDEVRIDISTYFKTWIPQNQDSVAFKIENDTNVVHVSYLNSKSTYVAGVPENYVYQQLSSEFKNQDNTFGLQFKITTDKPEYNAQGRLVKPEEMTIQNNLGAVYFIRFANDSITSNLDYIAEMPVLSETYFNVFTDNETFFYTATNGVIKFYDGNHWYHLIKK